MRVLVVHFHTLVTIDVLAGSVVKRSLTLICVCYREIYLHLPSDMISIIRLLGLKERLRKLFHCGCMLLYQRSGN